MYSPRVRDDLVPRIRRAAKEAGVPMTTWVNTVIGWVLSKKEHCDEVRKERRTTHGSQYQGTAKDLQRKMRTKTKARMTQEEIRKHSLAVAALVLDERNLTASEARRVLTKAITLLR